MPDFKPWPRITRGNPLDVIITEKIDGTNACVVVEDGKVVGAQSRKRLITPDKDNYGFAQWVEDHKEELAHLGDGYHYGEWAGPGIQKNPLRLPERRFFLFNAVRWRGPERPPCCHVVPILFIGELTPNLIETLLQSLRDDMEAEHEGIVVYHPVLKASTKHTLKTPKGKWDIAV